MCRSFGRLLAIALGIGSIACSGEEEPSLSLGIYSPFTSITHDDLAVAILFDLDFRKNQDPTLRERFGPPIIEVPNLHPDLRVSLQLGTSDSTKTVGVATTLDWFLGVNGFDKVVGVIGGYFSAIALGVAANTEVFGVPQVAFGATNTHLSDKVVYPWFLRTIPPDSIQGAAMWAWMNYFVIPSVTFFYRKREAYGEGLLQIALESANSAGQASRVSGIDNEMVGDADAGDLAVITDGLSRLRSTGSKFVIIVFSDPMEITMSMYGMEQDGMLYDSYQILGPDAFGSSLVGGKYVPSRGYPVGIQKFTPVVSGDLYAKYLEMWRLLQPADLYSSDVATRYKLDRLHVPIANGSARSLTLTDFAQNSPWFFSNFLFDAGYTFIHAINGLLNADVPLKDIHTDKLLQELRHVAFEGVTGYVSFDDNADRIGDFELWNVLQEGGEFVSVAVWDGDGFAFRSGGDGLTWAGGNISASAPAALVACAPGQRWDEIAGLCIVCPRNWYSMGGIGETAACLACEAGQISNEESGATGCSECKNGTYRGVNEESCEVCPTGRFAANVGQSSCVECPVGEFAASTGMDSCSICGAGRASQSLFATMAQVLINGEIEYAYLQGATTEEHCGCDRGARESADGECGRCGEGVLCNGMSDVLIEEGYYAAAMVNHELSVFRCHGEQLLACAGGVPGFTCSEGREGISCSDCKAGLRPGKNGQCEPCKDTDWWPIVALMLTCFATLVILYHLLDTHQRATQSHSFLLFACALGQLVTVIQQLGVIGMLSLLWEPPLDTLLELLGLLAFDIDIIRLNCVSPQGSFGRFGLKLLVVFQAIAVMLAIHVFFVVVRHHSRFRQRLHCLVSAIGTLFMIFNIAVTSTVLQPLQCQDHPNGHWTVTAYPGALCWSSVEHRNMLLVGTVAFLLGPVVCISACAIVVHQMPWRVRVGDTEFLEAFAFLFLRFRASCYSYALIHIVRSFLVAVVLVIPDTVLQILALNTVLLLGYSATVHQKPWRVPLANYLDCIFSGGTLIFACIIAIFVPEEEKETGTMALIMVVLVVSMLAFAPVAMLYGAYRKFCRSRLEFEFFLCHHKNTCGAFTRLLKMVLCESPRVKGKVFIDADYLDNLENLFEYVGHETNHLLVICTKDLWSRPWCIGEICTAHLRKVDTLVLLMAGCVVPDDAFIEGLESQISNLEVLTERGICTETIADALRWIGYQQFLTVQNSVTPSAMATLLDLLFSKIHRLQASKLHGNKSDKNETKRKCVTVYDTGSIEASSTAEILKKCLLLPLSHEALLIPEPLNTGEIGEGVTTIIVLCTRGIFEKRRSLDNLLSINLLEHPGEQPPRLLPLVCEHAFNFPPKDMQPQLEAVGLKGDQVEQISSFAVSLFKEIAIQFVAQHMGESQLRLAAKNVANRLLSKPATLVNGIQNVYSLGTARPALGKYNSDRSPSPGYGRHPHGETKDESENMEAFIEPVKGGDSSPMFTVWDGHAEYNWASVM